MLRFFQGGNMFELEKAKEYTNKLMSVSWVKWVHEGRNPAETSTEKQENVMASLLGKHCATCLNLNGCCFVKEKCPPKPLHPNCHCYTRDIPQVTARVECPIEKFIKYIFVEGNSKKQLFESWGYSIIDSQYLQQKFIEQAKLAYSVGEYELGKLDKYGQRINIVIKLKRKNTNEYVSFVSGWMVYPNGKIILNTPYGGK